MYVTGISLFIQKKYNLNLNTNVKSKINLYLCVF